MIVDSVAELGRYLGSPCEATCSEKLLHVFCEPTNRICECEKKYPVQIGVRRGCAKPKQLGDQCFYAQTCSFSDPNAICMQINHNAICQCKPGFHSVALRRGAKRSFCSEDQVVVSTDLPTLLGVATGIAVLTGLICFVLKLFNNNRYPNRRRYNNANMAPPLLFSSDNQWINGIPLTVHGRPSSRTSSQRSTTNLAQYPRCKGVPVPASRAGSRRPSISSIKSTTSSQKSMSYSARRFEQENQQKEQRAAMRAAREEAARLAAPPTPSPLSTDELLPACSKIEVLVPVWRSPTPFADDGFRSLQEDDPLGFASSVKSTTPKNGSISELSSKLSPIMPAAPRL
ncbi:UNVERIFIED_CONTAM: hypothetical protein PYX00_008132 [Menopon gallinae]|uniref:EB domain-containing protein n=1 Tax=Menopon gallinae TaxID=328185 RepID=A0AAW2HMH9_9NEOP